MRQLQAVTEGEANHLGQLVESVIAIDGGKPVSYAIADVCGDPILAYRINGASADSFWIALNKARTAVRSGKDTIEIAHQPGDSLEGHGWVRRPAHEHRFDDNRRTVNSSFVSWASGSSWSSTMQSLVHWLCPVGKRSRITSSLAMCAQCGTKNAPCREP